MLRDRYAARRPLNGSYPAQLTTRLLNFNDTCVTANADGRGGSLRVEVLDAFGYRVHGFDKIRAVPITTNDVAARVAWTAAPVSASAPAGDGGQQRVYSPSKPGQYSLRVHFSGDVKLYALSLAPCEQ